MIVSHRHRFIFIKTVKTTGTSMEVFLSQHCGPDDVVTPFGRPELGHQPRNHTDFRNHLSAAEVRERVGAEIWANYRTFCVERNPWDKVISHYHFVNQRFEQGRISWEAYLARGRFPHTLALYSEGAAEGQRCILVDQALRYERLDEELGQLLGALGIPFSERLEPRAKGQYRAASRDLPTIRRPNVSRSRWLLPKRSHCTATASMIRSRVWHLTTRTRAAQQKQFPVRFAAGP